MVRTQARESEIDKKIGYIKAMLSDFGNEMPAAEKMKLREQLYTLYSQAIRDNSASCGDAAGDAAGASGDAAGGASGGA
jgi:hypothetical protein